MHICMHYVTMPNKTAYYSKIFIRAIVQILWENKAFFSPVWKSNIYMGSAIGGMSFCFVFYITWILDMIETFSHF